MTPEISIIVPTRDRPEELEGMLSSILRGGFPANRCEVIIADNGTGGETGALSERFKSRFGRFALVRVPKPGLHEARHAGLAAASSRLLVFADDDIVVSDSWLASIVAAFSDDGVALVGGNNFPRFSNEPPAWLVALWRCENRYGRCIEALSVLDFGQRERDIPPAYVFGCNFAVRKGVVLDAGGFHPDGFPPALIKYRGDGETHVADYVRRCGYRARFVPGASVEHLVSGERMTREYFEKRYYAEGITDSYAMLRQQGAVRRSGLAALGIPLYRCRWFVCPPALFFKKWRWWRAYRRGFRFHQEAAAQDPALMAWVRQENYL